MSQVPMRQEQKTKLQALRDTFNSSIAEGDHCNQGSLTVDRFEGNYLIFQFPMIRHLIFSVSYVQNPKAKIQSSQVFGQTKDDTCRCDIADISLSRYFIDPVGSNAYRHYHP